MVLMIGFGAQKDVHIDTRRLAGGADCLQYASQQHLPAAASVAVMIICDKWRQTVTYWARLTDKQTNAAYVAIQSINYHAAHHIGRARRIDFRLFVIPFVSTSLRKPKSSEYEYTSNLAHIYMQRITDTVYRHWAVIALSGNAFQIQFFRIFRKQCREQNVLFSRVTLQTD